MAQTSDLIVVGSVTDVKPGRTVGDGEGAIQFRDLSVTIEIVLKGPANIGQVKVEEEGFIKGQPYSLHGSKWANRGARAVFFLVKKVGEPGEPYRLTNSQSRFFLNNDRVVPNAADGHREEFETRLSGLTAQELIAEVRKAQ